MQISNKLNRNMDSENKLNKQLYVEFNGFRFSPVTSLDEIKSTIEYNSKLELDLIINSRPKTGTTWVSQIVYLIINNCSPRGNGLLYPFYEFENYSDLDVNQDTLRIMCTHLPISLLPNHNNNGKTKFIYLLRNPKDVVVSFYHFLQDLPGIYFKGSFDEFFGLWFNGEVPYGDYFDSCLEWLKYQNNPNVLFVLYENLIRNTNDEIAKIAGFIDEKYRQKIIANDYNNSFMENVLKHCSIEHMRNQISDEPYYVRKGIIGDWRSHLSKEQSDIIDNKVNEKLSETGLAEVWKNDMMWQNL